MLDQMNFAAVLAALPNLKELYILTRDYQRPYSSITIFDGYDEYGNEIWVYNDNELPLSYFFEVS